MGPISAEVVSLGLQTLTRGLEEGMQWKSSNKTKRFNLIWERDTKKGNFTMKE